MAGNRLQPDYLNQDQYLEGLQGNTYTTIVDDATSTISYIGTALAGSSTASAVWQIFRLDTSVANQLVKLYANGDGSYTNIWTNRASLTYS